MYAEQIQLFQSRFHNDIKHLAPIDVPCWKFTLGYGQLPYDGRKVLKFLLITLSILIRLAPGEFILHLFHRPRYLTLNLPGDCTISDAPHCYWAFNRVSIELVIQNCRLHSLKYAYLARLALIPSAFTSISVPRQWLTAIFYLVSRYCTKHSSSSWSALTGNHVMSSCHRTTLRSYNS